METTMAEENKSHRASAAADAQNKFESSKMHARKAAEDLRGAAGAIAGEYRGKAEQAWNEARGKAEQAWTDARGKAEQALGDARTLFWSHFAWSQRFYFSRSDTSFSSRPQLLRSRTWRKSHGCG